MVWVIDGSMTSSSKIDMASRCISSVLLLGSMIATKKSRVRHTRVNLVF